MADINKDFNIILNLSTIDENDHPEMRNYAMNFLVPILKEAGEGEFNMHPITNRFINKYGKDHLDRLIHEACTKAIDKVIKNGGKMPEHVNIFG